MMVMEVVGLGDYVVDGFLKVCNEGGFLGVVPCCLSPEYLKWNALNKCSVESE